MQQVKYLIIDSERNKVMEELQKTTDKANKALETLKALQDFPCNSLGEITGEKIKAVCAEKIKATETATFLPMSEKQRIVADWKERRAKAMACCRDIKALIERYGDLEFIISPDGTITSVKPIQEYAEEKTRKPVPDKAVKHWELLEAFRKAVIDLREFEKNEDLRHVHEPMTISENRIYEGWVTGEIFIDHSFDHLRDRQK